MFNTDRAFDVDRLPRRARDMSCRCSAGKTAAAVERGMRQQVTNARLLEMMEESMLSACSRERILMT